MPIATTVTEHVRITSRENLAKARSEKKHSLKEVSEKTRIPERYLSLFESQATIPKDAYTSIYLKAYCKFLNLDYSSIVDHVHNTPAEQPRTNVIGNSRHPKPSLGFRDTLSFAALGRKLIFAAITLGVAGYVGYELYAMVIPPKLTLLSPQANLVTSDPRLAVQGIAAQEVLVTVNGKIVPVDNAGAFIDHIDLATGHNTITVSAKKKYGKPTIIERDIVVTPTK